MWRLVVMDNDERLEQEEVEYAQAYLEILRRIVKAEEAAQ